MTQLSMFPRLFCALFILGALPASGQTLRVVPNDNATSGGNSGNFFPFSTNTVSADLPMRYQQVYAASQFANLPTSMTITQITFRPNTVGGMFNYTEPDIQINLSTTPKSPDSLDTTFQKNVGMDDTIVYSRGPLPLFSQAVLLSNGTDAFDIVINLTTPFHYDPALGNLLLDVRNYGGTLATPIDATKTTGDSISRLFSTDVNSPTGTADTIGLITQFTFGTAVPPPMWTLSGTVTLQGCVNPAQKVTFQLQPQGSGQAMTVPLTLTPSGGSSGTFSIGNITPGIYRVRVKGAIWLATAQTVDLTRQSVSSFATMLPAGDANGDNTIDIVDFSLLVNVDGDSYNPSMPMPPLEDVAADFNCDGTLDIVDFSLLVNNYGATGAAP